MTASDETIPVRGQIIIGTALDCGKELRNIAGENRSCIV